MTTNEQIEQMGQAVIQRVTLLALSAGLVSAAAGWITILLGNNEETAMDLSAKFHLGLFVLLPLVFYQIERLHLQQKTADTLDNTSLFALAQMFTAILGGIAGNLMFFLIAIFIPVTFGGMDWSLLQTDLIAEIGWLQMGALVIVMVVTTYALPDKA